MRNDAEDRTTANDDAALTRSLIAALQENEAWFRNMVDKSPMGISVARDGVTLYANDACVRMFGYENPQEIVGTSQLNRVAPDYRWQLNLQIKKRRRGEPVPNQYEIMGLRKDGSTFPLLIEVSRVHLKDVPLSVALFTDFTERKRIEAALSSSEKRYRTLVETADDFITEINARGVILYASPGFYGITGYKPADILGRTPFDFMDPPYAMRAKRIFEEKARNKEKILGLQETLVCKDGSSVTLETNASPFFDSDGKLLGYCAASRDITHLKKTEDALRESERRYRNLVETIDEYIAESDATGRCTYASPKDIRLHRIPTRRVGREETLRLHGTRRGTPSKNDIL